MDTGIDVVKTSSYNIAHKTREILGNKTADAITKANDD